MFSADLTQRAQHLLERMRQQNLRLATAESCTGGLVAGLLTEIAGSSDVFDCGFVTYSNAAKATLLAIPTTLIATHGAVSEQVARAMAEGALTRSRANLAIAVTGLAGPGGGTLEKPVGLVHFGLARTGQPTRHRRCQFGVLSRSDIRRAAVTEALDLIASSLD
ncbi:MAG: nicotinamide-nucleotide amidohydrolase family protein [Hyphomicrobiaceae bacterium]